MAKVKSAEELLETVLQRDRRYDREAYRFVSESLAYVVRKAGRAGHVSGRELCKGLRDHALEQFGRLARTVLEGWGIRRSEDIGDIVFNMVDAGLLRKTDEDRREDFRDVFDFHKAFDEGFKMRLKPAEPEASDAKD